MSVSLIDSHVRACDYAAGTIFLVEAVLATCFLLTIRTVKRRSSLSTLIWSALVISITLATFHFANAPRAFEALRGSRVVLYGHWITYSFTASVLSFYVASLMWIRPRWLIGLVGLSLVANFVRFSATVNQSSTARAILLVGSFAADLLWSIMLMSRSHRFGLGRWLIGLSTIAIRMAYIVPLVLGHSQAAVISVLAEWICFLILDILNYIGGPLLAMILYRQPGAAVIMSVSSSSSARRNANTNSDDEEDE